MEYIRMWADFPSKSCKELILLSNHFGLTPDQVLVHLLHEAAKAAQIVSPALGDISSLSPAGESLAPGRAQGN